MGILVTRPEPDNETTAAALRRRGHEVFLAPMLRCEPVPVLDTGDESYGAVIVTSANALRVLEGHPLLRRIAEVPLFAVGKHTASVARKAGFGDIHTADGDADALRKKIAEELDPARTRPLLYLAGADLAQDLAGPLARDGFDIITRTAYRMTMAGTLPDAIVAALALQQINAILHYSRRSARAFFEAASIAGMEITALGIAQCCLSQAVAGVAHEAGAARVMVAAKPTETALFATLDRLVRPPAD